MIVGVYAMSGKIMNKTSLNGKENIKRDIYKKDK